MLHRDLLEVGGESGCRERPRAVQGGGLEPAAGDQERKVAVQPHPEQVAFRVVDPEQGLRPVNLQVAGGALQHDQLGRLRTDEHLGNGLARGLLAGQRGLDVLPVLVCRQLGETVRQLARHGRPRPGHRGSLEPRFVVAQVQRLAWRVLEEIPVRVQCVAEIDAIDRAPDGFAIEVHENRGRRRPEQLRWVGLDAVVIADL